MVLVDCWFFWFPQSPMWSKVVELKNFKGPWWLPSSCRMRISVMLTSKCMISQDPLMKRPGDVTGGFCSLLEFSQNQLISTTIDDIYLELNITLLRMVPHETCHISQLYHQPEGWRRESAERQWEQHRHAGWGNMWTCGEVNSIYQINLKIYAS